MPPTPLPFLALPSDHGPQGADFSNATINSVSFRNANAKGATFSGSTLNGSTSCSKANIIEANFVGSSQNPNVGSSLCSKETAFNSARVSYLFSMEVGLAGFTPSLPPFPILSFQFNFTPGWNVSGKCCFPTYGGSIRLGC